MSQPKQIAIIGGGPAGLMAATHLLGHGFDIHLYDAMPSLGRKFLMAGKSGLNLTHNEDFDLFRARYKDASGLLDDILSDLPPSAIRNWAQDLGIETFVGSSGRVFPSDFKAAPLLRAWVHHLRHNGVTTHVRHRWRGWQNNDLLFTTPDGDKSIHADATILALGSVCWPKLGSDGKWQSLFKENDIPVHPFKASNCGFQVNWSKYFIEKSSGEPVKSVVLSVNRESKKGDFVISSYGVEGSAIYTHSRTLREQIEDTGRATLYIDLCPDRTLENIQTALAKPRGSKSLSTHLRKTLGLPPVKIGLLRECLEKDTFSDLIRLAPAIKKLPLQLNAPRPIEEAISCAGGVAFEALDNYLMVKSKPGLFLAGEMLDWDAPTGGYLLTACFALGKRAGLGCVNYLNAPVP